jgi:hypothetical protein
MSPPAERLKLQGWNLSMRRKVDRECGCEHHQRRGNFSPTATGAIQPAELMPTTTAFTRPMTRRSAERLTLQGWNSSMQKGVDRACGCGHPPTE